MAFRNLIGTDENQVPVNGMLGGMAYQEPEKIVVEKAQIDELSTDTKFEGIETKLSVTPNYFFLYDTRKDSDGGTWRYTKKNTSWYNEELNTSTRGNRKEFPQVALIACYTTSITIYDADDPELPMWMHFTIPTYSQGANWSGPLYIGVAKNIFSQYYPYSICALNGEVVVGNNGTYHAGWMINFASDKIHDIVVYGSAANQFYLQPGNISERNSTESYYPPNRYNYQDFSSGITGRILSSYVYDLDMKVLPNAPIDRFTGLPRPTIAFATDAGQSVLMNDLTVKNQPESAGTNGYGRFGQTINFVLGNKLFAGKNTYSGGDRHSTIFSMENLDNLPVGHNSVFVDIVDNSTDYGGDNELVWYGNYSGLRSGCSIDDDTFAAAAEGQNKFLTLFYINGAKPRNSLCCQIRPHSNTGWCPADPGAAFLCEKYTGSIGQNIVVNGNFSSGTTGWTPNIPDGVQGQDNSFTINGSGQAVWTVTTGGYWIWQQIPVNPGRSYLVRADRISNTSDCYLRVGLTGGGSSDFRSVTNFGSGTWYSFDVPEYETDPVFLQFGITAPGTLTFDNVEVIERVVDETPNRSHADVTGTLTRTQVYPGSDIVGYSGWSGSNYTTQSYNSTFQYGTGAFTISAWVKNTDTVSSGFLCDRATDSINGRFAVYFSNNLMAFYTNDTGGAAEITQSFDRFKDLWTHVVCTRTIDGHMRMYINGKIVSSNTQIGRNVDNGSANLYIGVRHEDKSTNYFRGSISMFRSGKIEVNDEQVKRMFNDERALFQENSKCTLYGSYDDVNGFDFDEKTGTLHVGTLSGRSDFQGLRRINNTTTPVITDIHAYDGFIVEQ